MADPRRYLIEEHFTAGASVCEVRAVPRPRSVPARVPGGGGWATALTTSLLLVASAVAAELPPLRFTVFAVQPIKDVAFAPRPNAAPQSVVFYPTARSPRYEYRGPIPLRFVDPASGRVVAEATVPSQITDALLLFSALEAPSGSARRYQIAILDDGAVRHQIGHLALVNLSGLSLSGVVGRHAVLLEAGLNAPLEIGTSARIALRAAFKERTFQAYADFLEIGASERALLILFPPYYSGSLEVQSRMLIDRPPKPAAGAPAEEDQKTKSK